MFEKTKRVVLGIGAAAGAGLAAVPAQAAITMPTTLDFTNFDAAATLVIGGLVVIWGVRKLIKLFNRS